MCSQEQDPCALGTDPAPLEEHPEIQEHPEVWHCWEVAQGQLQAPQILPTLKQSLEGGTAPFPNPLSPGCGLCNAPGMFAQVEPCSPGVPKAGSGQGSHPQSPAAPPDPARRELLESSSSGDAGAELSPHSWEQPPRGAGEAEAEAAQGGVSLGCGAALWRVPSPWGCAGIAVPLSQHSHLCRALSHWKTLRSLQDVQQNLRPSPARFLLVPAAPQRLARGPTLGLLRQTRYGVLAPLGCRGLGDTATPRGGSLWLQDAGLGLKGSFVWRQSPCRPRCWRC